MLADTTFTEPHQTACSLCTVALLACVRGREFSATENICNTAFRPLEVSQIIDSESGNILRKRNEAAAEPVEGEVEVD